MHRQNIEQLVNAHNKAKGEWSVAQAASQDTFTAAGIEAISNRGLYYELDQAPHPIDSPVRDSMAAMEDTYTAASAAYAAATAALREYAAKASDPLNDLVKLYLEGKLSKDQLLARI